MNRLKRIRENLQKARNKARHFAIVAAKTEEAQKILAAKADELHTVLPNLPDSKKARIGSAREKTLTDMKPGIQRDLLEKLQTKELAAPIDSLEVANSIHKAVVNTSFLAGAAMRVMNIGIKDIQVLVEEVCRDNSIQVKGAINESNQN